MPRPISANPGGHRHPLAARNRTRRPPPVAPISPQPPRSRRLPIPQMRAPTPHSLTYFSRPRQQNLNPLVEFAAAAALAASLLYLRATRRPASTPPGPPPLPLIGNLLDIPREKEVLTYNDMADKYGAQSPPPLVTYTLTRAQARSCTSPCSRRRSLSSPPRAS